MKGRAVAPPGIAKVIEHAYQLTASDGKTILVGIPKEKISIYSLPLFFDKKLKDIKKDSKLDEGKAAIITGLNITNDYLKNLSSSNKATAEKSGLKKLALEIEKHLESLSKIDN